MKKIKINLEIIVAENEKMSSNDWENLRNNLKNYVKEYIRINRFTPGLMTTEIIESSKVESKIFL